MQGILPLITCTQDTIPPVKAPNVLTTCLVCRFCFAQEGSPLPDIELQEGVPDNNVKLTDVFKGKKGILFGVPGAFTPGCSKVAARCMMLASTARLQKRRGCLTMLTDLSVDTRARVRERLRQTF